jgi:hypothetical protein
MSNERDRPSLSLPGAQTAATLLESFGWRASRQDPASYRERNRLLVNQLWNTSPHDPLTLVSGVVVIVVIGLCACWVPAMRAMRVEPIAALRHE